MIKKLITSILSLAMLQSLSINSYAASDDTIVSETTIESGSEDSETSFTTIVTRDTWDYDLIWTINEHSIECVSSDDSISFNMNVQDDTLYVNGLSFVFSAETIPNFFEDENTIMLSWILNNPFKNIVFSDDIESVAMRGLAFVFNNTENIELGNSLKRIEDHSFILTKIKTIKFPETLVEIGNSGFSGCKELKEVVIPSKVEIIGEYAFAGCTQLKDITILSKDVKLADECIGYSTLGEAFEDIMIHGYKGSTTETYALKNGFTFIALEEEPITTTAITSTSIETTTTITSTETDVTDTSETTTTSTETDVTDTSETTTTSTETDITDTSETTTTSTDEQLPQAGMPWARTVEGLAVMLIAGGTILIVKSRRNEG